MAIFSHKKLLRHTLQDLQGAIAEHLNELSAADFEESSDKHRILHELGMLLAANVQDPGKLVEHTSTIVSECSWRNLKLRNKNANLMRKLVTIRDLYEREKQSLWDVGLMGFAQGVLS